MRVLPQFSHTCHVCGSTFTVRNRIVTTGKQTRPAQQPRACPCCDARIAAPPEISVGIAKGLLLSTTGLRSMTREYGSPEAYLAEHTLTEDDVDRLMALVRGMDYDAWAALNQRLLSHDRGLSTEARQVPRLREAAESGGLLERLDEVAARTKAKIRARHRRHLALFERRQKGE